MDKIVLPRPDMMIIRRAEKIENRMVLETDCHDFDHFRSLPDVVEYRGDDRVLYLCGKTGWSSDSNYACYQSGIPMAQKRS